MLSADDVFGPFIFSTLAVCVDSAGRLVAGCVSRDECRAAPIRRA